MLYAASRAGDNLGIQPANAAVSIEYCQLDLADRSSINALVARVKKDHGGCDVLINGAKLYGFDKPVYTTPTQLRRQIIDLGYRGTLKVDEPFRHHTQDLVHWSREFRLCAPEP